MGRHGAASTPHLLATQAAIEVMKTGGNAVDAAVAAAAVCAVVQPSSSSIGGVGWATVYDASSRSVDVLKFQGAVPATLDPSVFRPDAAGILDWATLEADAPSLLGTLSPGVIPGYQALLEKHGSWTLGDALGSAIAIARQGFPVSRLLHDMATASLRRLQRWPESAARFLPGGDPPEIGALLVQADLAETLDRIARNGAAEVIDGETAQAVADYYASHGGALSAADLASTPVEWDRPLALTYHGYSIYAASAPLGDVSFLAGLGVLERLGPFDGPTDPKYIHASVESAKLIRTERIRYLGADADPSVIDWLMSAAHLNDVAAMVGATVSHDHVAPIPQENTITLTVVDERGNAVHLMQTVGTLFGTAAIVPGTGFFNNSSGYFAYVGGQGANRMIPGLGLEQNPCLNIVLDRDARLRMIVGSPGGKTRVETVRQMLVNVLDFGMNLQQAVDAPRFLASTDSRSIEFEAMYGALDPKLIASLESLGHRVQTVARNFGTGQGVAIDPTSQARIAAADWRVEAVALAY